MNKIADFFHKEYRSMVRYVRSRIDDAADRDAEDIVQDVIVNIFNKADLTIPVEKWAQYRRFWQDEGKTAFEEYLRRMEDEKEK